MPEFSNIRTVYFLGIGGIGMSALARYFLSLGKKVCGYDRTPTPLTAALQKEGMLIHFEENTGLIPEDTDLVVYTPAVPVDHSEYRHFTEKNILIVKRAEVLGLIADQYRTVAIAGTHGKTTTSTLCAHLLYNSPVGCQAFLGGISRNYSTNLLLSASSPFMVAEADEFDRSFLHIHPEIAIITSIDADHLDIYHNLSSLIEAFTSFSSNIRPGGTLLLKEGLVLPLKLQKGCRLFRYSANGTADFYASNILLKDGLYHFDFNYPTGAMNDLTLGLPGLYNVENAVAAMSAAFLCGVTESEMHPALASFKGVSRRFDIRINRSGFAYVDDYAHHPEELTASITAARKLFAGRKITGIFQPHLFTRTRDFADEFAKSLDLLDEVILLPVYPARELPIPGVNSEMLLSKISCPAKKLVQKSELPACLDKNKVEVLLTLGAGDIDTLVAPIESYFNSTKMQPE